MSKKIRFKGQIRTYLQWPIRLIVLIVAFNLIMFKIDTESGVIMLSFTALYTVIAFVLYFKNRPFIKNDLVSFATQYGQIQKQLLRELEYPYAILDEGGKIIWTNEAFERVIGVKKGYRKNISTILPEVQKNVLPGIESETELMISHNENDYRISMKKVLMDSLLEESAVVENVGENNYLIAFFMFDETRINSLQREIDDQKLATGLIYIDNYEEALESIEEVRTSLLVALIDRKINRYFSEMDALVKKLEKDKYLVILQKKYLNTLAEKRFDILEDVKTVNIGNEIAVTLSIGFGVSTGLISKTMNTRVQQLT